MRSYLPEHSEVVVFRVRPQEKANLKREAERQGVPLSTLIRQALRLDEPLEPLKRR